MGCYHTHPHLSAMPFSILQLTPSLSFLIENVLVALLIIIYLAYEIRFGRGKDYFDKISALTVITIAIARENPNIDDERVEDRLNGNKPSEFQDDEP